MNKNLVYKEHFSHTLDEGDSVFIDMIFEENLDFLFRMTEFWFNGDPIKIYEQQIMGDHLIITNSNTQILVFTGYR
jgi:hypothetical protein